MSAVYSPQPLQQQAPLGPPGAVQLAQPQPPTNSLVIQQQQGGGTNPVSLLGGSPGVVQSSGPLGVTMSSMQRGSPIGSGPPGTLLSASSLLSSTTSSNSSVQRGGIVSPINAAQVQKMLDENCGLIQTIQDFQNMGKSQDCMTYHAALHRNLVYLAQLADPTMNISQILPPPHILQSQVMQQNAQQSPHAIMTGSSSTTQQQAGTPASVVQSQISGLPPMQHAEVGVSSVQLSYAGQQNAALQSMLPSAQSQAGQQGTQVNQSGGLQQSLQQQHQVSYRTNAQALSNTQSGVQTQAGPSVTSNQQRSNNGPLSTGQSQSTQQQQPNQQPQSQQNPGSISQSQYRVGYQQQQHSHYPGYPPQTQPTYQTQSSYPYGPPNQGYGPPPPPNTQSGYHHSGIPSTSSAGSGQSVHTTYQPNTVGGQQVASVGAYTQSPNNQQVTASQQTPPTQMYVPPPNSVVQAPPPGSLQSVVTNQYGPLQNASGGPTAMGYAGYVTNQYGQAGNCTTPPGNYGQQNSSAQTPYPYQQSGSTTTGYPGQPSQNIQQSTNVAGNITTAGPLSGSYSTTPRSGQTPPPQGSGNQQQGSTNVNNPSGQNLTQSTPTTANATGPSSQQASTNHQQTHFTTQQQNQQQLVPPVSGVGAPTPQQQATYSTAATSMTSGGVSVASIISSYGTPTQQQGPTAQQLTTTGPPNTTAPAPTGPTQVMGTNQYQAPPGAQAYGAPPPPQAYGPPSSGYPGHSYHQTPQTGGYIQYPPTQGFQGYRPTGAQMVPPGSSQVAPPVGAYAYYGNQPQQ